MSGSPEPDRGPIGFAEKLMTVLGEGRYTATYKYAVLLGLMDLCLEHSTASGAAPRSVATPQLAEKVLELYWHHTTPFPDPTSRVLRQNVGGQAELVSAIARFRERQAGDPSATLTRARIAAPARYEGLVREIEWKLVEMPLARVQVVGDQTDEFLYRIGWTQGVRRSDLDRPGFDRSIRFVGNAADHLVRLSGLLRPIIQREWTRLVARLNADIVPEARLEDFLFGVDRTSTAAIRGDLRDLQDGRCFYCNARLGGDFDVDHFVPWVRYPDNGIENLVASDRRCNGAKCDHLASASHVEHWLGRIESAKSDLAEIASRARWERRPDRTLAVARSIYLRLPTDAKLWHLGRDFVPIERPRLVRAFEGWR